MKYTYLFLFLMMPLLGISQTPETVTADSLTCTTLQNDSGYVLQCTRNNQVVFNYFSFDGFLAHMTLRDLNNDLKMDVLFEERYCDGTLLYASIWEADSGYRPPVRVYEFMAGEECEQQLDGSTSQLYVLKDINHNNTPELLIFHTIVNNKLTTTPCADTIYLPLPIKN